MNVRKIAVPGLLLALALTGCGAPRPPQPSGSWMPVNRVSIPVARVAVPIPASSQQSSMPATQATVVPTPTPAATPSTAAKAAPSVRHVLHGVFYTPASKPVTARNDLPQGVMHEVPLE